MFQVPPGLFNELHNLAVVNIEDGITMSQMRVEEVGYGA
jgi:hypothetical protein